MTDETTLRHYLRRTASALLQTRSDLHRLEAARSEPIAVVGIGCRYPGGIQSPDDLWDLVNSGADVVSDFPDDRGWRLDSLFDDDPDHRGTVYARTGGFLDDALDFDADFFGIAPREALAMDPQQRLLLEVSWEALEHAGLDPAQLRGSECGVFVGAMYHDYASRLRTVPSELEAQLGTGSASGVLSGRLSYVYGFTGPTVTVDTACSSSLVAMHQAIGALRGGECELALAGGVTVMSTPSSFVEFSRQRGLARDGRCKAYAASADGTGFSEGVGVLVLERLSDAIRNGHRVRAVLRGSAVNSDGASTGLTVPNGAAQQRVIRQALSAAGIQPGDIDMLDGHGTGTTLGDPIEVRALLDVFGGERDAEPLWLGSVKSNLGHTQAAAGVAGVIKTIMAIQHATVPATLHVDAPTPHVDWADGAVQPITESRAWPQTGRPRRGGVSSFGISGTNAHVIVEQAPETVPAQSDSTPSAREQASPLATWVVSAKSDAALADQAGRLAQWVRARPDLAPTPTGRALTATRSIFAHRAVIFGRDRGELLAGLDTLAVGGESPSVVCGVAHEGRIAVMFPGQGAQRNGMTRTLYATSPTYAAAFDEICAEFDRRFDGIGLADVIFAEPGTAAAQRLDRTSYTQAALFTVEVALYRLAESFGLRPDFLIGHSIGELTAAYLAGVWSLADAAELVVARGRMMDRLPGRGAMLAVAAGEHKVAPLLVGREHAVSVAAINGTAAVVLSGTDTAVDEIAATLETLGRRTKRLQVAHAFHSPLMDPMLAEFTEVCRRLEYHPPRIPLVSDVTGAVADPELLCTPEYWAAQVRQPVRFHDGITGLHADRDVRMFLEIGPGTTLTALAREAFTGQTGVTTAPLLPGRRDETDAVIAGLATVFAAGTPVDWYPEPTGADPVPLPTHAFQRRRYWLDAGSDELAGATTTGHRLLDRAMTLADDAVLFSGSLSREGCPWIDDHVIHGVALLPATAFVDMALFAASWCGQDELGSVDELTVVAPLIVPAHATLSLQAVVGAPEPDGTRSLTIHSRVGDDAADPWTRHVEATLGADGPAHDSTGPTAVRDWPPTGAVPIDVDARYRELAAAGFHYGSTFRATALFTRGDDLFADVVLAPELDSDGHRVHPAMLDAALHPLASVDAERTRLPFSWRGIRLHRVSGPGPLRARLSTVDDHSTVEILDTADRPVLSAAALVLRTVDPKMLEAGTANGRTVDALFGLSWVELPGAARPAQGRTADITGAAPTWFDVPATDPTPAGVRVALTATLDRLRSWLAEEESAVLTIRTRGAVAVGAETVGDPGGAAVWGLVRSAQTEHPGRFVLVDVLDSEPATLPYGEPQIAVRADRFLAPRLVPAQRRAAESDQRASVWNPEGTVLITGASGGLGGLVARHLAAEHGVRHLLLVSRGAIDTAELTARGVQVTTAACDVTDSAALAEAIATIPAEHPLIAVVHAAGVVDDGVVDTLTPEQFERVLRPKVDGAWNLHNATRELNLTAFVLFSSVASVLGAAGQGNYAAANAYLDALAGQRRAEGLPATALAWGLWARQTGITGHLDATDHARLARTGIFALSDTEGLRLFDAACEREETFLAAVALEAGALDPAGAPPPLRDLIRPRRRTDIGAGATRRHDTGATDPAALSTRIAVMDTDSRREYVRDLVRDTIATVLGHAADSTVDADRSFKELGFDSLTGMELRTRLGAATGLRLPATLVFDYPTPDDVAAHLEERLEAEILSTTGLSDDAVRATLARIPIQRLREVGLLDSVLRLADEPASHEPTAPDRFAEVADPGTAAIASMSAAELIRMARGDNDRTVA
ncbi:type I polyketide synthase [Nocardia sp. XZ_19_231]|uniref:type I polyketide synthase n=1 Tax=Nocardia sp. XZ_19_231 TaxID=2769252 RepID=UPI0018905DAD|nr:type I polyketide synthase [Nocardia sp. XZ_19_231]